MMDWMIGTGIAVSLLIVLVLLVRRPFARMFGARAAYALWLLPFIRLVMPEVTVPRFLPNMFKSASPETALPNDLVITPEMMSLMQQVEPSLTNQAMPYILPAAISLWALGAVVFFLYHWTAQASLMDRLTYASEPALSLKREIVTAAQSAGLKHSPIVRISDEKAGPLVAGFIRPVVMLPDNFMTAFSPAQRHYALMHEFMHIKRGDIWVALGWLAFRAVNWPNPLVHYAAKAFRSDQEAACDASVLSAMGDSKDVTAGYAETLIHAAKAAMTSDSLKGRASPLPSQLALTIHHPLKERLMILGTHRKTSNWRSRTAAAVMIIGAATLSAPLIQADSHPEEELAGKHETHTSKSVIKRLVNKDGIETSEHFEINVDGDDIKAYRIGPSGEKIRIDVKDIEGVDGANIIMEDIEGIDIASLKHRITISDGKGLKTMSRDDFKKWAEKEYPEWKEKDFASWVDGDFAAWAGKGHKSTMVFRDKDGKKHLELKNFPHPPKPPHPPGLSSHSENVFVFESDDLEGLEGLEGLAALQALESLHGLEGLEGLKTLKSLKGLEKLKALEALESLKGTKTFRFSSGDFDDAKLKMHVTESKLAAAMSLLEETEVEADDSREMAKAKRELEKARKALKAAERALKDAK